MFHVKHSAFFIQPWQQEKLLAYAELLKTYNHLLNLVSRRTREDEFIGHIQECLALAAYPFDTKSSLADWGSGAGLPAIPLAIVRPDVNVYAVDSVQKKILSINAFRRKLDLSNLFTWHGRAENFPSKIKYSVSRGVAPLHTLWNWHLRSATPGGALYCLKGGDLNAERAALEKMDPNAHVKLMPVPGTSRIVVQVKADLNSTEQES